MIFLMQNGVVEQRLINEKVPPRFFVPRNELLDCVFDSLVRRIN